MKKTKIEKKYSSQELAESFVFRSTLSDEEVNSSKRSMLDMRDKMTQEANPKQIVLSKLLQLKFQMEDYLADKTHSLNYSFGYFLQSYLDRLEMKYKDFASDIDIAPTKLSQYIHDKLKPNEKVLIRLEIHSNNLIPAVIWYRLLEKQEEHRIATNEDLRMREFNYVRKPAVVE